VFPDADVLAFSFGIPYEHYLGHRGLSHSLSFAFALSVAIGLTEFRRASLSHLDRLCLISLFFFSMASHGLLDSLTNGGLGIGLFLPFHEGRFFAPWRPLEVSPIGVQAFLSGGASAVLASEAVFVLLPLGVFLLTALIVRRLLARRLTRHCS
jgi:inner membrane protein